MVNYNRNIIILADDPNQNKLWASVRYIQERLILLFQDLKHSDVQIFYLNEKATDLSNRDFSGAFICYMTYTNLREGIFIENPSLLHPDNKHFIWSFGNITHFPHLWLKRLSLLQDHKVCFVCASKAAEAQIKKIFSKAETYVLPYFVDTAINLSMNRDNSNAYVFAYGGRLVRSKGVDILLENFYELSRKYSDIRLVLYGEVHYRNYILHGIHQVQAIMGHAINRALLKSKQIEWVRGLSPAEFERELSKVNCYVSLSMYHDEDFGVSLRQAYFSGARLVGSYWGGQKDTLDLQKNSIKIKVYPGTSDLLPHIKKEDVYHAMEEAYLNRSQMYNESLPETQDDYLEKIENLFKISIEKFDVGQDFIKYCEYFLASNFFPFQKKNVQSEYYYEKYYNSYY